MYMREREVMNERQKELTSQLGSKQLRRGKLTNRLYSYRVTTERGLNRGRPMSQHTPSSLEKSEPRSQMLNLSARQGFGANISDHVLRGAVGDGKRTISDLPSNKEITNVDVF